MPITTELRRYFRNVDITDRNFLHWQLFKNSSIYLHELRCHNYWRNLRRKSKNPLAVLVLPPCYVLRENFVIIETCFFFHTRAHFKHFDKTLFDNWQQLTRAIMQTKVEMAINASTHASKKPESITKAKDKTLHWPPTMSNKSSQ